MDYVKFNGNTLATIDGAGETLKFYYAGDGVLELETGRPSWWAKIEILEGCTINSLEVNAVTYYEESDWTFTTTAPTELRVMAVAERPYAGDGGLWNLVSVTFNGSLTGTSSDFAKISFANANYSGKLYHTEVHVGGGGGAIAGEKTNGGTVHNLYFLKSDLGGKEGIYTEITFAEGYRGIAEKQTFYVEAGLTHDSWAAMPMWKELPMQTVNYKVGDSVISTVKDTTITLADPTTIDGYSSEKTFIGWTDGEKLYKAGTVIRNLTEETTFTAVELGSFAQEAPELRTVGSAGVRFVTTFNSEDYALYEGKFFSGFGTVIARSADLTANNEKLTDVLTGETTSVIVKIESTVQGAKDGLTYVRGGIMNMYAHNFDKELVGAGYVAVEYATGVEYIVTAESKVVVKEVAESIISKIESGEYSEDDFDMTLINAYAGINA